MSAPGIIRSGAFIVKGMQHFTQSGYQKSAAAFSEVGLVSAEDFKGKHIIVTGANSGIGYECAKAFLNKGAIVHMVCRSEQRANDARTTLIEETKNEHVHVHIVDLSQPRIVKAFTSAFVKALIPLSILINNAGACYKKKELNDDGLEMNFATNTLGSFLMTEGLIQSLRLCYKDDKLQEQENFFKPRVITVSSGGMYTQDLSLDFNFDSVSNDVFDGVHAYATNKRQQTILTEKWSHLYDPSDASKHDSSEHGSRDLHRQDSTKSIQEVARFLKQSEKYPIAFASMHPGWADTPIVKKDLPDFYEKMKDKLRTPFEGADTIIWLSLLNDVSALQGGPFYFDRKPQNKHMIMSGTQYEMSLENEFYEKIQDLADSFEIKDNEVNKYAYINKIVEDEFGNLGDSGAAHTVRRNTADQDHDI